MEGNNAVPDPPASKTGAASAESMKDSLEVAPLPEEFEIARKDPILPCFSLKNLERNAGFFG